jgi:hypothetical protein
MKHFSSASFSPSVSLRAEGRAELKGYGYLVSILSVLLLAVPALKSASESTFMATCLVLGMLASMTGMGLRWMSHLKQQSKIREVRREARSGGNEHARAA